MIDRLLRWLADRHRPRCCRCGDEASLYYYLPVPGLIRLDYCGPCADRSHHYGPFFVHRGWEHARVICWFCGHRCRSVHPVGVEQYECPACSMVAMRAEPEPEEE